MRSHQSCPYFFTVYIQQHTVESFLDDTAFVVSGGFATVCDDVCLGILHHYASVPVIGIGDGVCILGELVEERLLAAQVFRERSVVVKMVVREV